jgi:hypothetical protein
VRFALVTLAVAVLSAGAAQGRSAVFLFFRTPSGNIGCVYGSAEAGFRTQLRCDIRSGLLPRPPRPARCDLEYGDSYELRRTGRASLVCHGDTVFDPRARVLAYGAVWSRDGFRCSSQEAGLRCTNRSGHGFFLSRAHSFTF